MQRKFLEDLSLGKDVIDKIMTENGNDINATKQRLEAERDAYKEQLDTAQKTLKDFEGVDVQELQEKVQKLTADLASQQQAHEQQLAEAAFTRSLEDAIAGCKAKNTKAVMALLDVEKLRARTEARMKAELPDNRRKA